MKGRRAEPPDEPGEPDEGGGWVPPAGGGAPAPLGQRRSPLDLYAELLEVLRRSSAPCRITRLSYAVGMPVDRTHRAVRFLVRLGLVTKVESDTPAWLLSRRGYEFLQTYWKLRSYLGPLDGGEE